MSNPPIMVHDPDCPMTNSDEESRTVCVCDDAQHFAPDGSHRTVPTGGGEPERTWGQVLYEHWCDVGPGSEDFRRYWRRMPAGERDWWERLAQGARPASVTDEMVERAARAVHEISDDVLPFDLGPPHDPRRSAKWNDTRSALIDRRRERYMATARAALEAALGGDDA